MTNNKVNTSAMAYAAIRNAFSNEQGKLRVIGNSLAMASDVLDVVWEPKGSISVSNKSDPSLSHLIERLVVIENGAETTPLELRTIVFDVVNQGFIHAKQLFLNETYILKIISQTYEEMLYAEGQVCGDS